MLHIASLQDFYREMELSHVNTELGHFNVFNIASAMKRFRETKVMPYNRRAYYKISLINGRNRAEYADKVIDIKKHALLFASPRVPYNYVPLDEDQSGSFCIFSREFLSAHRIDDLPVFKPRGYPVFLLK